LENNGKNVGKVDKYIMHSYAQKIPTLGFANVSIILCATKHFQG
jgi:hypothetical protein